MEDDYDSLDYSLLPNMNKSSLAASTDMTKSRRFSALKKNKSMEIDFNNENRLRTILYRSQVLDLDEINEN